MTPTEKARRSDSLYYDTHGANRRNLCDMIAEREDRIEELEAENTKLRELVQSAVRCITDVPNCESCALGEQVSGVWVCHLIGAAKELGIEVDG